MTEEHVEVSYYEAPRVAMQMMDGLEPTTLYDNIKGKNILNYLGVSLLANIMDVEIISVEIVESETDENYIVVCAEASNPANHKGFSYIGKPKKVMKDGELVHDESYRSKAYTNAKRNALKDLVPHQVLCEMLVKEKQIGKRNSTQATKAQPSDRSKPEPTAEAQKAAQARQTRKTSNGDKKTQETLVSEQLKEIKDKARQAGVDALNGGLFKTLGIDVQDCMNEVAAQTGIEDTDKWTVAHWEQLIQIIERPVAMGMTKAVEAYDKLHPNENTSEEDAEEVSEDSEEEVEEDIFSEDADDEAVDAEDASDDEKSEEEQLSMFIEELNGDTKS